jgi:hypothetical protein
MPTGVFLRGSWAVA